MTRAAKGQGVSIVRIWKKKAEPDEGTRKPVDDLTPRDFSAFPVWEYANDEEGIPGRDETWMRPVQSLPVSDLSNRIAAVPARLANGESLLAALSNVSLDQPSDQEHFLVIGLYRADGEQFVLARYHDHHRSTHGSQQLAAFLGLPLDDVFPISYDLSSVAVGQPASLLGIIHAEPSNPLSRSALIKRAVQKNSL